MDETAIIKDMKTRIFYGHKWLFNHGTHIPPPCRGESTKLEVSNGKIRCALFFSVFSLLIGRGSIGGEGEGGTVYKERCVFDEQKMMGRADGRMSTQQEEKEKREEEENKGLVSVHDGGDWRLEK
jgi:hypothetical protein